MALSQRPFVAVYSEYCEDIGARLVSAQNQGAGPALDVEAALTFEGKSAHRSYLVGCMAVGQKFQFLLGNTSNQMTGAAFSYKSMLAEEWTSTIRTVAGNPIGTRVTRGNSATMS